MWTTSTTGVDNYFQGVSMVMVSQGLHCPLKCLTEDLYKYNTLLQLFLVIVAKVTKKALNAATIEASATNHRGKYDNQSALSMVRNME